MPSYTSVTRAHPYRLLGPGNQQADTGLLYTPPRIRQSSPTSTTTVLLEGLGLGSFELQNRAGATISVGIGCRLPNRLWIAGQWDDDAATPYTDDTTDAQDTGTGDFLLEGTAPGNNNDGFVIASLEPFNAVSIDVGTASAGTDDIARAVRYSNSTGDGWTVLSNFYDQTGASTHLAATGTTAANEALIVFDVPSDWGKIAAGGLSGIPAGYYALNVRATAAPTTTAAVADALAICRLYFIQEVVTDNTTVFRDFAGKDRRLRYGNGLVAYFGTANAGNHVSAEVRVMD